MDDKLLKRSEALTLLRVGAKKLDELVRRGDLEVTKLGTRTIRIREGAVRDLLQRCTERGR